MANMLPLPILVEILVNGAWTDISKFLMQRDGITITGGAEARADMGNPQPASCSLTLKNTDSRFTPQNASGPYFPYLGQNVQIRVSLNNATSSSGNTYTGYRFWGEVPEWPSQTDLSQHDVFVQIVANGPLRRINTAGGEGSSLARYYASLTGAFAPIAYWPCEEDEDTELIGPGTQGGSAMNVTAGTPKWKHRKDFNGSAPIGVLNRSTWDGLTGFFGTSGDDIFLTPGQTAWVASTTSTDVRLWGAGGGGTKGSEGNSGGTGGGGGGTARNATLATVPGATYYVNVGAGSPGCLYDGSNGQNGQDTTFTDSSGNVLLRAHGGGPGGPAPNFVGAGGVAGTGGFAGGPGGFNLSALNSGGGGGGAAGLTGAGGGGGSPGVGVGGAAGIAGTGGGGGNGGVGGSNPPETDGGGGKSRGGGGAGGWANQSDHTNGGAGSNGAAELVYTSTSGGTLPNANICRAIVMFPEQGGNPGKVIVRYLTGGTIARLDVQYATGGKLTLVGYNSGGTQLFTSGPQAWNLDNQPFMFSAELATSGANVAWSFSAIRPGDPGVIAPAATGTVTTATIGNVTEVLAGPNGDITKTAVGHISVQYALVPLWQVSKALHGHFTEVGVDRFLRLCNEQAMDNALVEYNEGVDHWGFEPGIQSWTATNGALTQSSFLVFPAIWPTDGSHSLLLTANGAGQPAATSPSGLAGQPVQPGDIVSAAADAIAGGATALNNAYIGVKWYDVTGASVAGQINGPDTLIPAGIFPTVLQVRAKAPATTAFFAIVVGDHETPANGTLMNIDNVRCHPHMGVQTKKAFRAFLEEIRDLDAGIMKEAKELWGFKYRTRIRMINQTPTVTLDFSQGTISPPFIPSLDTQNLANDIILHRYRGSKVRVTLQSGTMSVIEPPGGKGRHLKQKAIIAAEDEMLLALAAHLLNLGTDPNERYPSITVDLTRASIKGAALAPLMSAVAGTEVGDYVKITNLPVWYPQTPAKQLVIGYTETLNRYQWVITWNCVAEQPYEITAANLRRW